MRCLNKFSFYLCSSSSTGFSVFFVRTTLPLVSARKSHSPLPLSSEKVQRERSSPTSMIWPSVFIDPWNISRTIYSQNLERTAVWTAPIDWSSKVDSSRNNWKMSSDDIFTSTSLARLVRVLIPYSERRTEYGLYLVRTAAVNALSRLLKLVSRLRQRYTF